MRKQDLVEGQYVHLDQNDTYREAYVFSIFDKFVMLKLNNGRLFRYDFNSHSDYELVIPTRDGQRVMAKKTFWGKYKTKPADMR